MPLRRGVTLIEAVTAIVLLALVAGAVSSALRHQQRSARELAEVHAMRGDLRDAAAILARELRGVAPAMDTIRVTADTAIELFTPVLVGIVCADAVGGRLLLAPTRERGGGLLTSLTVPPDTGDLAWVWTQDSAGEHGFWRRYRVTGYSQSGGGQCDPALSLAAAGSPLSLTVAESLDGTRGGPVWVVRRGRYSVYRSSDGLWYLGHRRCNALGSPACGTVQPVAGPYRARTAAGAGLRFSFFDRDGTELVGALAPVATARVEVVIRSDTTRLRRRGRRSTLDDSVVVSAALRNGS